MSRMNRHSVFRLLAACAASLAGVCLSAQGLPVPYERLLHADQEPGNWLMYSNTYNSWRYSRLAQIDTGNVARLKVKWLYQMRTVNKVETTPLVVNGIMYVTRPENDIIALDAETGRALWTYEYRNPARLYPCCGRVNRGVALLGNRLFMNTLDMHVVAVDARSGRELWRSQMFDYTAAGGYAATGAPLVVKDKVIVGMAGAEHGVRGFLDAYDASTGKLAWRFNTIPKQGEPNYTWSADSGERGGASTWNTGSYDPESNTLYWGTGNPWPDTNGDVRLGDDLYSCSVIALDPDTGKLKWHFQFTPHDLHDWDATQVPVLVDADFRGQPRKLLLWPNRNGFFYVLDRQTGEFLTAKAFVRQTWAKGFDDKGRPELIAGNDPTPEGNVDVWPGVDGGANWMAHSYSPLTGLLYTFAREEHRVYAKTEYRPPSTEEAVAGFRGRPQFAPEESFGKVLALDPGTADIKWEYRVLTPPWSGVMATAGNLVFGGTLEGNVFALDARTGKRLWRFPGNGPVFAAPVSFLSNGRQLVSLAVGDVLMTFSLDGE
jgi:alcohol dehydrogenase (cytochrome c)